VCENLHLPNLVPQGRLEIGRDAILDNLQLSLVQIGSFQLPASIATTRGVRVYLGKNGMCALIVRRGPEGRRLNVSPARKGWVLREVDPERRRCGTRPRCYQRDLIPLHDVPRTSPLG
jgi:hypothetical protein